jgi:hypothetical protein
MRSGNFTAFTDGGSVVFRFISPASITDYREMTDIVTAAAKKSGKVTVISLLLGGMSTMDEPSRQALKAYTQATDSLQLASAVIITSGSLTAMVVRTIVNGLNVLSSSKVPMKAFTSISEALAWLQGIPGQSPGFSKTVSQADLEALVQERKAA